MVQAIVLAFLAGLMGLNGVPHFVTGITGREFPNLTGNSATNNAVDGLAAFAIAAVLLTLAHVGLHPWAALIAGAVGAVLMTVFHARRGAYWMSRRFGRPLPEA
jgi:O-antigen/teichoic acid export membrane protein